jgi:hypothetical protein
MKRVVVGFATTVGLATTVLVSGGLGMAGLGEGIANAATGPYQWCPGEQHTPEQAVWDMSRCHTWWYVGPGQGNVAGLPGAPAPHIWDGDNPPAPTPPPGMPPFLCRGSFTPQQCDAWGM